MTELGFVKDTFDAASIEVFNASNPLGCKPFGTLHLWAFDEGGAWRLYLEGGRQPMACPRVKLRHPTGYAQMKGRMAHRRDKKVHLRRNDEGDARRPLWIVDQDPSSTR